MHELQLLDNQWHCAYCFMDVKMERMEVEKMRQHQEAREEESEKSSRPEAHERDAYHYHRPHEKDERGFGSAELHGEDGEGGEGAAEGAEGKGLAHKLPFGVGRQTCSSCGRSVSHGYYEGSKFICGFCHAQEFKTGHAGFCVKCGREFPELYIFKGEQLCLACFADASNIEATSWVGKLRLTVSKALKVVQRPQREALNRKFSEEFRQAQEREAKKKKQEGKKP
jgi:NMD protein affecting ribosome stability and mRNA decay